MMGHRQYRGADEFEAFTRWRRLVGWRRGELRRLKRALGKRIRHDAKLALRTAAE